MVVLLGPRKVITQTCPAEQDHDLRHAVTAGANTPPRAAPCARSDGSALQLISVNLRPGAATVVWNRAKAQTRLKASSRSGDRNAVHQNQTHSRRIGRGACRRGDARPRGRPRRTGSGTGRDRRGADHAPSYDWSGPYAGAQLGWGWADASPGIDGGNNFVGGLHGGYRWDFGQWVAGGELEYNWTEIDLEGTTEDANFSGVFNVKATAGMEMGPGLFYGIIGWGQAQVDGNYDALIGGLGLAYPINDRWVASGEWLYYGVDDYGLDEADSAWANTLTLRVSYEF